MVQYLMSGSAKVLMAWAMFLQLGSQDLNYSWLWLPYP